QRRRSPLLSTTVTSDEQARVPRRSEIDLPPVAEVRSSWMEKRRVRQRNITGPDIFHRDLVVPPARLKVPRAVIRGAGPVPLQPLAKIVVGLVLVKSCTKIWGIGVVHLVVDIGHEHRHGTQRVIDPRCVPLIAVAVPRVVASAVQPIVSPSFS